MREVVSLVQNSSRTARRRTWGARIQLELKKNAGLYLLALVPFVYLALFKYWPMYGVQIAFKDYSVSRSFLESPWVGLKHIQRFIEAPKFWQILKNTLLISLYGVATFPLPILLAVMLNYLPSARYRKTIQMISYAPHFISTVVMVGIINQFLDKNTGAVNLLIEVLGGEPVNFLAKRELFYHVYQWTGVWQGIGYASIIYISALSSVPAELHEAAIVDGAGILQRIWHIDIPCILPTVCILLIMQCGGLLNVGYEKIFLMQNNLNLQASEVISTYVYKQGLTSSIPQYSYSTAINLFVSIVNAILLVLVNQISNRLSGNGLW